MAGPVFVHIGPEGPADTALAQLFRANGHAVACHEGGRLAADVHFAMGQGQQPLAAWPDVRLFAGLYRHQPHWRPPLDAWRCAAFLRDWLPQARFVLIIPPQDRWPLWRARTGALACHVARHGLPPAALPGLWQRQLATHLEAMRTLFRDDPRLLVVDTDLDSPADLAARLDAVLPMQVLPFDNWPVLEAPDVIDLLTRPDPPSAPAGWAADVARFCLQGLDPAAKGSLAGLSPLACRWDGSLRGRGAVTDPQGNPRQFTLLSPSEGPPLALARDGRHFKLIRAEGVINDILSLNRRDPVWIDMEDSRWFGSPQGEALDRPVLCHNRREGAVNAVLWPLPDQHAIGLPGFDPAAAPDTVPFEDKEDRLIWRGMISGSEMRDGVKPGPAAHVWLKRLAEASDAPARRAAWQGLCRTNRLAFVRRFFGHPDFDLGVVMAPAFRSLADDPLLAPFCTVRAGHDLFRRFRYQLYLTGYDHGSNFMTALDSRSVLLAEQDGWQVFYSNRFKPWQHFIPIARHAVDIEEKLAWARAHPAECKAMSQAARQEAAFLRDPAARRDVMRLILDGLAAAR
ncbi:glycosyl transferase family 90 [Paracoccus sp. (in: a-proteobacteria)]|uniref:glycosyl transferase family 90 n=1 Tax=Paracoccus sp. TaxID=267 RepID=UPI00396CE603